MRGHTQVLILLLLLQINYIRQYDSKTVGKTIIRVIKKLMSDGLQQEINWTGAHGKLEFRKLIYVFETIRGRCTQFINR